MLGRLLCRLGVHDSQVGFVNWDANNQMIGQVGGRCVRPHCSFDWVLSA